MKRLSISLLFTLALLACGKTAQQEEIQWRSGLTAKDNNLVFAPDGGERSIILSNPVTQATCAASWISVNVDGTKVSLTAERYSGSQTRYTVLMLKSAVGDLQVPVAQYGVVIEGLFIEDIHAPVEGIQTTQTVKLNTTISLETDAQWIHAEYDPDTELLTITVDENTAPLTREGNVSYSAGAVSGSAHVIQEPPLAREQAWTLTAADSYYEDPDFFLPVSLSVGNADKYVLCPVSGDVVEGNVQDWIFQTLAPAEKERIEAIVEKDGGEFKDYLYSGSVTGEVLKLPGFGDTFVIAIGFGDNAYITGQYQYVRLTVKDTRPGYFDNNGEDMDWGTF